MHACMHAWMHAHTYSYVSSVPRAPILAVSLQSPTNHIAPLIALSHRIASSHRFIASLHRIASLPASSPPYLTILHLASVAGRSARRRRLSIPGCLATGAHCH